MRPVFVAFGELMTLEASVGGQRPGHSGVDAM